MDHSRHELSLPGTPRPAAHREPLRPAPRASPIWAPATAGCPIAWRCAATSPVAIDILGDPLDGLAAGRHYQAHAPFPRISAEFDDLPLAAGSLDLVIYNASIHYSTDYRRTLAETRRCLRPDGCF